MRAEGLFSLMLPTQDGIITPICRVDDIITIMCIGHNRNVGLILCGSKSFFCSPQCPDWLWDTFNFPYSG
jgi:hypothetical protein